MASRKTGTPPKGPERIKETRKPRYMRNYKYRNSSAFMKTLGRSITAHMARFISLFAIIALGAGVYAGLRTFVPDMYETVDSYYDETNFMDLQVNSTMGLTDDDLEAIQQVDGVRDAAGAIRAEMNLTNDGLSYYTAVTSMDPAEHTGDSSETVNQHVVLEGRLPLKAGEIALSLGEAPEANKVKLGDTLEISKVTGATVLNDVVDVDELTVVGFVHSPLYASTSLGLSMESGQPIQRYGFITQDSFSKDDIYTDAYITVEGAKPLIAFTDPYKNHVDETRRAVKAVAPEREQARKAEVEATVGDEIDDAQRELNEKRAEYEEEIAKAQQEIADAEAELADGIAELEDGQAQYDQGVADLESAREEIASGEQQLADGIAKLDQERQSAYAQFADSQTQLNDAKAELDAAARELNSAKQGLDQLEGVYEQLMNSKSELDAGQQEIDDGRASIAEGRPQLEGGIAQARLGLAQAEEAEATLPAQITEMEAGLAALQQQRADLLALDPAPEDLEAQIAFIDEQIAGLTAQKAEAEGALAAIPGQKEAIRAQIAELEAQLTTLDDTEAELDAAQAQIDAGRATWQQGMDEFEAGLAAQGFSSIDEVRTSYSSGYEQWAQGKAEYDAGLKALAEGRAQAESAFAAADAEIAANRQKLNDGRAAIVDGEAELRQALTDLEAGRQKIADGQADLEEGKAELEKEMADAERQFAEGQAELNEARADLEDLDDPLWYILTRDANASANIYSSNAERINSILTIFPIFFFLVSALVSLTTMTRMVESERMEIGTLKALGYSNPKIASKYLIFAGAAAVLGSVIGIAIFSLVLPYTIWLAYSTLYPDLVFKFTFSVPDSAVAFILTVGSTLLVTGIAAAATLKERPTTLMQPRAPKPGKRILLEYIRPLWRRLPFSQKVTARNLFRYKSRMIMTVVGVAGCTALLLTGFGVRNYLDDFIDHQFTRIQKFDMSMTLDLSKDEETREREIQSIIEDVDAEPLVSDFTLTTRKPAIAENPTGDPEQAPFSVGGEVARTGGSAAAQLRAARSDASDESSAGILRDVTIVVPQDIDAFPTYYNLVTYEDRDPIPLEQGSVIISQRLSEHLMAGVGDTIELSLEADADPVSVRVSGITLYYIGHYVFMGPSTYTELFGETPEVDSVLAFGPDTETDARRVSDDLRDKNKAIAAVTGTVDEESGYSDITSSLGAIVGVIVLVSGALAFIVLYNLTNINIEERHREIATIKVLGFYNKEVNGYIFRETIVLSILATILGLPMGFALTTYIMRSAEMDNIMFFRQISPFSYVIAAVLTLVFTLIVTWAMSKKLKQIDMVSSLSANE